MDKVESLIKGPWKWRGVKYKANEHCWVFSERSENIKVFVSKRKWWICE